MLITIKAALTADFTQTPMLDNMVTSTDSLVMGINNSTLDVGINRFPAQISVEIAVL
jgi:hypothetical protein